MSLTYGSYAGNDTIRDAVLIARNGPIQIYYVDHPIDILTDNDPDGSLNMITKMVDEEAESLRQMHIGANKLNNLDLDIYSKSTPTVRKERKIYNAVMNRIAALESRLYYPRDGKIRFVPRHLDNQRDGIYVAGPSGAGKTYFASRYSQDYQREFPGNNIYLFSRKNRDPLFDEDVQGIIRVPLDRHFISSIQEKPGVNLDPLDRYHDSLLIFDDFESIIDKDIRKAVMDFKNSAFQLGRYRNISCISIQHKALGGAKSLVDICESNILVIFPKMNLGESIKMLAKYCSYTKDQIEQIFTPEARKERVMVIIRPNVIITEKFIKVIDQ
jgi:hypothetical protein